jgi:hypothetical protein
MTFRTHENTWNASMVDRAMNLACGLAALTERSRGWCLAFTMPIQCCQGVRPYDGSTSCQHRRWKCAYSLRRFAAWHL